MKKFKKGDKVLCVNDERGTKKKIIDGEVYKVRKCTNKYCYLTHVLEEGYYIYRFVGSNTQLSFNFERK